MTTQATLQHAVVDVTESTSRVDLYARQTRRRKLMSAALTIGFWVSIAVSLALWLASGGAAKFTNFSQILTQLGIATGLLATQLCVLMLILASRAPFIDQTIGHDRAIGIHGKLGKYAIIGLVLHAVFLIFGWAASTGGSVITTFVQTLKEEELFEGFLGLIMLIVVGVLSFATAKRLIGHEAWHVIHLLTYVAIGLSLPHQFSHGLFRDPGPMRYYWMGIFVVAAFLLLTYRAFMPLFETLTQKLRVTQLTYEEGNAITIELRGPKVASMGTVAGQFFHFRFLAPGLWWHQHPFSISAPPTDDTLRITVRDLGKGTHAINRKLRVGTRVAIEGPYGIFTDQARTTAKGVVLIGAGIGIAPIRALLESTHIEYGSGTVILRASTKRELFLVDEIKEICMRRGIRMHLAVGPRACEGDWLPADMSHYGLQGLAPDASECDFFVCGPNEWSDLVVADALANGVPAERIHHERFNW